VFVLSCTLTVLYVYRMFAIFFTQNDLKK